MAAPPPTTPVSPIVVLIVRILTLGCLFISTVVLATSKITLFLPSSTDSFIPDQEVSIKFTKFYAFRYLISVTVIGMAYTLLQTALSVVHVTTGKRIADILEEFDFYADFGLSNLLISGAAASFGLTVDLNRDGSSVTQKFVDKIYASASLCLLAFVLTAISAIISHKNSSRKI